MKIDLPQRTRTSKPARAMWLALLLLLPHPGLRPRPQPTTNRPHPILKYIATGWDTLTRSMTDCNTVSIPSWRKTRSSTCRGLSCPTRPEMQERCHIKSSTYPQLSQARTGSTNITPPGLLYLPNKYVVPGGRFNEMYGWTRTSSLRGLVEDKRLDLRAASLKTSFRDRALRTVLNAKPHLFPDALATAVPDFDDPVGLQAEKAAARTTANSSNKATSGRARTTRCEPRLAPGGRYRTLRATSTSGNRPAPEA